MNVVIAHVDRSRRFCSRAAIFFANSWGSGVSKNLWWLIISTGTWHWTRWGGRFSWSQYSGNAGEGRNLLTTIREPQLCATEGFMRMWVISSTVESNIINTCCFFCFCKNAHKSSLLEHLYLILPCVAGFSCILKVPIHGMRCYKIAGICTHMIRSCDMRCNVAMKE